MTADAFLAWLAPIAATFVTCAGQLALNARFKHADEKRDEARVEAEAKRAAEAEWRESIDQLMEKYGVALESVARDRDEWYAWREDLIRAMAERDRKIDAVLGGQLTQMRSDMIHRIHRYMDDLGCASIEEKDALKAEHDEYCRICKAFDIENEFIDGLVQQVMDLPSRPITRE